MSVSIYKPTSAVFTVSATAITLSGLLDVNEQDQGAENETYSDGATAVTGVYIQRKKLVVAITMEDNSKLASELFVGQAGTLVVTQKRQLDGIGLDGADLKTVTYPGSGSTGKAVVTAITRNHVFQGNPSMQITLTVFDATGDHTLLKTVT